MPDLDLPVQGRMPGGMRGMPGGMRGMPGGMRGMPGGMRVFPEGMRGFPGGIRFPVRRFPFRFIPIFVRPPISPCFTFDRFGRCCDRFGRCDFMFDDFGFPTADMFDDMDDGYFI